MAVIPYTFFLFLLFMLVIFTDDPHARALKCIMKTKLYIPAPLYAFIATLSRAAVRSQHQMMQVR